MIFTPVNIENIEGKNVAKRRTTIQTIKKQAGDYARAASLHGLAYIGEKERNVLEK